MSETAAAAADTAAGGKRARKARKASRFMAFAVNQGVSQDDSGAFTILADNKKSVQACMAEVEKAAFSGRVYFVCVHDVRDVVSESVTVTRFEKV